MEKRILFVDDERSILRSIERSFFDLDYEVFVAASGEEGLSILRENPIDIVVSDMRMPEMDGHQFLRKVKTQYPGTTRLILSGYADEKEIIESLVDGSTSLYLFKPWNGEELIQKIEKIFEIRQILNNQALLDIVNDLGNLSVVTGLYETVTRLIEEDASTQAIARAVETDPAVTASVLRVVNSAFYRVRTSSVAQAITFLGLPVIKSIVLSCSLFRSTQVKVPPFNMDSLARHANTTNLYMTTIYSKLLKKQVPETLATAGLLHKLGLLILLHYFPVPYRQVAERLRTSPEKNSLALIEKDVFGATHPQLGGHLLNWWNIPYPTVECALFCHEPLHESIMNKEAVAIIHLANYYTWRETLPCLAGNLDSRAFSVLGISQPECENLLKP